MSLTICVYKAFVLYFFKLIENPFLKHTLFVFCYNHTSTRQTSIWV